MRKNLYQNNVAKFTCGLVLSALAGFFIFYSFSGRQNLNEINHKISANTEVVSHSIQPNFAQFPLSFEANAGQIDGQVKFVSRGHGFALFLTDAEAVLSLRKNDPQTPPAILRMRLDGANQTPEVVGHNELAGKSNYFVGDNPNNWKTDIPNFSSVRYEAVYPGIDQVFYGNGRELEYDFIVAPETDYQQIAIDFTGADALAINESGELVLTVSGEQIVQKKPLVYQDIDGKLKEIAANYSIQAPQSEIRNPTISFEIGEYDRSKPLVIDPVLVYSTYLGGMGADIGRGIEIDTERNVYVTGSTFSTDFPTVNPFQSNNASPGFGDVFVTKINAAGNAIVYSTYIGGSYGDIGYGIDVDNAGNAYVTGVTGGTSDPNNFPTTAGAFDRTFDAPDEAFLLKLNAAGNALVYSTYTGATIGFEVKVDKTTGEAFITGNAGTRLQTTPGAFRTTFPSASSNSFVTKFNATGSGLIYSTYIGPGPANDLAIDADGNAYITGSTISNFFPITPGAAQPTCTGCSLSRNDAFITKLNTTGTALLYSTYLGGSQGETGTSIAVDAAGNAYVTGSTGSGSGSSVLFPTTSGAYQTTSPGVPDAFVTKVNPTGTAFVYSTFLGGDVTDQAFGIAVDPSGSAHVIGQTRSRNFPLVLPFQSSCTINGPCVFISSLNPTGSVLTFSTFFGQGEGLELVADTTGSIYATGRIFDGLTGLPTMNAIQPAKAGGSDAFVAKIEVQTIMSTPTPTPTATPTPTPTPMPGGLEADVAMRPNGDGAIQSDDVVQIRRFLNATNTPDPMTNEFQRADSAPFAEQGDGVLNSADVVQTRRYQNGTSALQMAGGPLQPNGPQSLTDEFNKTEAQSKLSEANLREVRVESTSGGGGQTVTVNILVDAAGDESEYGFILDYDESVLSNPVIGAGNAGASVRSCNASVVGQITCSVGGFAANNTKSTDAGIGEIGAGSNQILISVTFTVAADAAGDTAGDTPLKLSNVNAASDAPQLFTPGATDGMVTILAAARDSISDRVWQTNRGGAGVIKARVELSEQNGDVCSARTNPFGYYQFTRIKAGGDGFPSDILWY